MVSNNVLILGPPRSGKLKIARHILPNVPQDAPEDSHSGLIYNGDFSTKYYQMSLKLFIEEYPDHRQKEGDLEEELAKWTAEFVSEECKELQDAIEGVIFTTDCRTTSIEQFTRYLSHFEKIKEVLGEEAFAVVAITPQDDFLAYEDECIAHGMECVDITVSGKTGEFNEKQGVDRIREVLETQEWSQAEPISSEEYIQHKEDKMDHMTERLLDENDEKVSIDELQRKLEAERAKVSTMDPQLREAYAQSVVDEIIDYI